MEPDHPGTPGFHWDEANIEHIARHGLDWWEVEDAVRDSKAIAIPAQRLPGQRRFALVGASASGRVLVVIFERRIGDTVRVITAYPAAGWQLRRYRRR